MKRLVSVICAVFCLWAGSIARAGLIYETVATFGDQGQYASIALDSQDTPHAAWYDETYGRLMYGKRSFLGWEKTQIDAGFSGKYASIAVNPQTNQPAIAYLDENLIKAKYAYYDGSWNTEYVVFTDDVEEGTYIDLAFASDGFPCVSYHYDNGALHSNGVNVVCRTSKGWEGHRLDYRGWLLGKSGTHTAIAMSSADFPHVAYLDTPDTNQRLGWQDGTGWTIESAIGPYVDNSGRYSDIALDTGDNVYISSFEEISQGDNCVVLFTKNFSGWNKETIACGPGADFGKYTSLVLDANNDPHVTFCAHDQLHYAVRKDDLWEVQTLDDDGITGYWTGLSLSSDDRPHVVYYNAVEADLLFIRELPSPQVGTVDPATGVNTGFVSAVIVTGSNFTPDSTASLYNPDKDIEIFGTGIAATSETELSVDYDLTGAWPGIWDVRVTTPAGTGVLEDGFVVTSVAPVVDSIHPTTAPNSQSAQTITITGNYFAEPMSILLEKDKKSTLHGDSVGVNSVTQAEAIFDLRNARPGTWDLTVITDFGQTTLPDALEVTCGPPSADFEAAVSEGSAPLSVQFSDLSQDSLSCEISQWEWEFGDGSISAEQSPKHVYQEPGVYTVRLTIIAPGGTDTVTKSGFIVVSEGDDDDSEEENSGNWRSGGGCCSG